MGFSHQVLYVQYNDVHLDFLYKKMWPRTGDDADFGQPESEPRAVRHGRGLDAISGDLTDEERKVAEDAAASTDATVEQLRAALKRKCGFHLNGWNIVQAASEGFCHITASEKGQSCDRTLFWTEDNPYFRKTEIQEKQLNQQWCISGQFNVTFHDLTKYRNPEILNHAADKPNHIIVYFCSQNTKKSGNLD